MALEGRENNIVYAEQTGANGPLTKLAKYVDQSYLREAVKELDRR